MLKICPVFIRVTPLVRFKLSGELFNVDSSKCDKLRSIIECDSLSYTTHRTATIDVDYLMYLMRDKNNLCNNNSSYFVLDNIKNLGKIKDNAMNKYLKSSVLKDKITAAVGNNTHIDLNFNWNITQLARIYRLTGMKVFSALYNVPGILEYDIDSEKKINEKYSMTCDQFVKMQSSTLKNANKLYKQYEKQHTGEEYVTIDYTSDHRHVNNSFPVQLFESEFNLKIAGNNYPFPHVFGLLAREMICNNTQ
jgi:hypothetical protein